MAVSARHFKSEVQQGSIDGMAKSGGRKRRPQGCSLRSHRLRRLKPLTPTLSPATHSAMPSMLPCCTSRIDRDPAARDGLGDRRDGRVIAAIQDGEALRFRHGIEQDQAADDRFLSRGQARIGHHALHEGGGVGLAVVRKYCFLCLRWGGLRCMCHGCSRSFRFSGSLGHKALGSASLAGGAEPSSFLDHGGFAVCNNPKKRFALNGPLCACL